MTARQMVTRFALMTCTVLGYCALATSPALAGDGIPSGAPRSPLLNGATPFTQKLIIYEEFGLQPLPESTSFSSASLPAPGGCDSSPNGSALDAFLKQPLWPAPLEQANIQGQNPWLTQINDCLQLTGNDRYPTSPIEGRPPGKWFAHQEYEKFRPEEYFQSAIAGARTNKGLRYMMQRHRYNAATEFGPSGLYAGGTAGTNVRLHPRLPVQNANSVWTFDGTLPPKVLMARYGHPVLFRQYNALPIGLNANRGFGANTTTTHFHNGHSPGESDGFPGAYFFPGQYYDYRWPLGLAGRDRINPDATEPKATDPDGNKIPGDYRETLSTMWFHDHRHDFTSQNVYKGMAAMVNLYGGIDRGNEADKCHYAAPATNINLCLPSGTHLHWGNRDYDVNLTVADKAWDSTGQLYFNIFNTDGFLGDRMTVNWAWQPYLDVRPRRYRFRILNGSVARFFKIALVTAAGQRVPFHLIANDGNIMEHAVAFPNAESQDLPFQSVGERFDIVVDFKSFAPGAKLYLVNLAEHKDGRRPELIVPLAAAMAGRSEDPAVGKFLEFRVAAARPGTYDSSMNPADYVEGPGKMTMIPLPNINPVELAGATQRLFEYGRSNGTDDHPWTLKTDDGVGRSADKEVARVSAVAKKGELEIWTLKNGGGGWAHPGHIHFAEGRILSRDGNPPPVWERWARKDMYNIGPLMSGDVRVAVRFEDFVGSYVQHCHNTTHEDKAMLLRFDVDTNGLLEIPAPQPQWGGVGWFPSYLEKDEPRS